MDSGNMNIRIAATFISHTDGESATYMQVTGLFGQRLQKNVLYDSLFITLNLIRRTTVSCIDLTSRYTMPDEETRLVK